MEERGYYFWSWSIFYFAAKSRFAIRESIKRTDVQFRLLV